MQNTGKMYMERLQEQNPDGMSDGVVLVLSLAGWWSSVLACGLVACGGDIIIIILPDN